MKSLAWRVHESMCTIRAVEEHIAREYPTGQIRTPVHLCVGQEAVPVAITNSLSSGDLVFSHHRSHGHYLALGGDIRALFAELLGRVDGCCLGIGGSQHLSDPKVGFIASAPILAGTVPIGVGYAWHLVRNSPKNLVVVYLGDAVIEEGVFHESLNFAATHQLPVLFVCENNLYSVHAHIGVRQPRREIFEVVEGHGVETLQVDGNDALGMITQIGPFIDSIRSKPRPIFIEAQTYRMLEHVGPSTDWHLGYRAQSEGSVWTERDPIKRVETHLYQIDKEDSDSHMLLVQKRIEKRIREAWEQALVSPTLKYEAVENLVFPANRGVHD